MDGSVNSYFCTLHCTADYLGGDDPDGDPSPDQGGLVCHCRLSSFWGYASRSVYISYNACSMPIDFTMQGTKQQGKPIKCLYTMQWDIFVEEEGFKLIV